MSNRHTAMDMVAILAVVLIFALVLLGIIEDEMAGYGPYSYFISSPEERAEARALDEEKDAQENFVESLRELYKTVACPREGEWKELDPAEREVWHSYHLGWGYQPIGGAQSGCYARP